MATVEEILGPATPSKIDEILGAPSITEPPSPPGISISPERIRDNVEKVKKAKIIANTFGVPFSLAYDYEESFSKALSDYDPKWSKTAGRSFLRGVGSLSTTAGRALQWAGAEESGEELVHWGRTVQYKYMPPVSEYEITWDTDFVSWLATRPVEAVPFALSLIPAALAAAYVVGAGAATVGLGAFTTLALKAIGAGTVMRLLESSLEAGGTYDEALHAGLSPDEASKRADFTFKRNLVPLTGVDIAQFFLTFVPLARGPHSKIILKRIAAAAAKITGVGAMEAGEEAYQEAVQQMARGEKPRVTPEMTEATIIGGIFGVGMGGTGTVFPSLVGFIKSDMPAKQTKLYNTTKEAALAMGLPEETAEIQALDAVAETPEGKAHIEKAIEELKGRAEGTFVEQEVDFVGEIEKVETEELLNEEDITKIVAGQDAISVLEEKEVVPAVEEVKEAPIVEYKRQAKTIEEELPLAEEGYTRLWRGNRPGEVGKTGQFTDDLAGIALPFRDAYGGKLSYVDIRTEDLPKYRRGVGATEAEFSLPKEIYTTAKIVEEKLVQPEVVEEVKKRPLELGDVGETLRDPKTGKYTAKIYPEVLQELKPRLPEYMRDLPIEELTLLAERHEKGHIVSRMVRVSDPELFETIVAAADADQPLHKLGFSEAFAHVFTQIKNKNAAEILERHHPNLSKLLRDSKVKRSLEDRARKIEVERKPGRPEEVKVTKPVVEKVVPAAKGVARTIREDTALQAAFKKAEQDARIAQKTGETAALEQAKADFRDVLIKARVKTEIRAFQEGTKVGTVFTANHLAQVYKDTTAATLEARETIVDFIEEHLPPEVRGKFLNAVVKNMTPKRQMHMFQRVEDLADRLERRTIIRELEKAKKMGKGVALEYRKQVDNLLHDIDLRKMRPGTADKLQTLKDSIEKQGISSSIRKSTVDQIRRLEMIPAADMSREELKNLRTEVAILREDGKLKQTADNVHDAAIQQKNLETLLADTHNLDTTKEKTKTAMFKRGLMFAYLETLQGPRVFDMIDGYKNYRGTNAELGKQIVKGETEAIMNTRTIVDAAVMEMHNTGVTALTEEQQVRIMINIRQREGAYDQVNTLMRHYKYDTLPALTEQESGVIDILRKYTTANTAKIAAIFEDINKVEFPLLPEYVLPLEYQEFQHVPPSEAIKHTRHRTAQTFQGFTIEREAGVKKLPETDIFKVFEHAIATQQWYINLQPVIENISQLVKSKTYIEKAGILASNYWADHLDIVARRGWSATAHHTPFSSLLRKARGNITQAILGYKLSSIIMQPFAIFDALAYSQSKFGTSAALRVMSEFTKSMVIPGRAQEFVGITPALQIRKGGEVAIQEALEKIGKETGTWSKLKRGGLSLLVAADIRTAAGVEQGLLRTLEKMNIPNAKEEADFLMSMVSASSEVSFRPHVLARGEGARAWFTFQTFFLNRWGLIAHDLITSGLIRGKWKAKFGAMIGLGILIAGSAAENEARKFMYEFITKRRLKHDASLLLDLLFAIPYNIPILGNLLEAVVNKRSADIPIMRTMENLFKSVNVITGKTTESKVRGILRSLESVSTLYGIPGTAQFFDVLEGFLLPEEEGKPKLQRPKLER